MAGKTTKLETTAGVVLGPPQKSTDLGSLGPYRVIRVIGKGGMGVVFLGVDPKLRRKVALKVMLPKYLAKPQARDRFLREARALAAVENDHVVPIYQVDEEGGTPYIALKYLQGSTLEDYLCSGNKLSLAQMLHLAREVATGLQAAHEHNVIHRDIKPNNIWLEAPEGRVRLIDFGLARLPAQSPTGTIEGSIVGTPAYMSPEQARGGEVDARSDLFSLGGVLYRLFAGVVPFKGDSALNTVVALTTVPHVPLIVAAPHVPEALSRLVDAMLAKDPAERPASARDVVKELKRIESRPRTAEQPAFVALAITETDNTWAALETDGPGTTGGHTSRTPLPRREMPVWLWVAGAVALAVLVVLVAIYSGGSKTPASAAEVPKRSTNPKPVVDPYTPLFNGKDLTGWVPFKEQTTKRWIVADGVLAASPDNGPGEYLISEGQYGEFELRLDYRLLGPGGDAGIVLFATGNSPGLEIQLGEVSRPNPFQNAAKFGHGSIFGIQPAFAHTANPPGQWNTLTIVVRNSRVSVEENRQAINERDFSDSAERKMFRERHPGLFGGQAPISLQCRAGNIEFRNIRIRD